MFQATTSSSQRRADAAEGTSIKLRDLMRRQSGVLTRISAKWCGVLAALLLSAPVLSATAVGDGGATQNGRDAYLLRAATDASFRPRAAPLPSRTPSPLRPPPPPVPAQASAPVPTPVTPPPVQPPPAPAAAALCADALSVNVLDAELAGDVQAGVDLLTEYFGCQKFRLDGSGVPIKFGEITPLFNDKVLGYATGTPAAYEIWLNRDCWGVVERWAEVIAHELGHYLGWQHGDDHPYMWLTPPPGSYARPGDANIVCY